MKEYNYDEIRQMQEKALERVRDMQTRTHQLVNAESEKTPEQKTYRESFYNAVKSASKADYIKMPVEYSEKISDYESFEKYFGADSSQESNESTVEETEEKSEEISDENRNEVSETEPVSVSAQNNSGSSLEKLIDEPDKALLLALLLLFQADKANEELMMSLLYIML